MISREDRQAAIADLIAGKSVGYVKNKYGVTRAMLGQWRRFGLIKDNGKNEQHLKASVAFASEPTIMDRLHVLEARMNGLDNLVREVARQMGMPHASE